MLRNLLLTLHLFGAIVWIGFGTYEILLSREIRKARGTPLEIPLIRMYGKYAGLVALATLVVAAAGVSMSIFLGWGFFSQFWLGAKQAIMLLILADMIYLLPVFLATAKATNKLIEPGDPLLQETRDLLARIEKHVIPMRVGAVVAVVLAIWRPV
jgi:uncharacterized membrane protein